ncbi:MAG: DUF1616 domain-containing protein [Sulfolobales archaeon]
MILDEEVFAVILAVSIVASVIGVASVIPRATESFMALGLLDEFCRIGSYPSKAYNDSTITLCIFVYNHMGRPVYYKVVYKIGSNTTIPTNTTPSPESVLAEWRGVLNMDSNTTFKIKIPVYAKRINSTIALIFELWVWDTSSNSWKYSGVWNHLYVNVVSRE